MFNTLYSIKNIQDCNLKHDLPVVMLKVRTYPWRIIILIQFEKPNYHIYLYFRCFMANLNGVSDRRMWMKQVVIFKAGFLSEMIIF